MKKTNCLALLVGLLSIVAFLHSCDNLYVTYKNYVGGYFFKESLRIIHIDNNNEIFEGLFCVATRDGKYITENSTGEDKELFEALCIKNKDTSYNRKFIKNDFDDCQHSTTMFLAERITDISITSETDWNSDYPAGSSLNDLFLFLSCSPDAYILNGYKKVTTENPITTEEVDVRLHNILSMIKTEMGKSCTPIYGTLSNIAFEKYNLMGAAIVVGWFVPAVLPDNHQIKIKVTITFESGETKVLEDSLTPTA